MKECKKSTNATDADVKLMKRHQIPETHEAKCFMACVLEKSGAVCRYFNLVFYHRNTLMYK